MIGQTSTELGCLQRDSSDRRADRRDRESSFKPVLPPNILASMARRTAHHRGAALIVALAVSCHALRTPLRLSRPFSSRVADVRRRSAAVALDDDGALDAASTTSNRRDSHGRFSAGGRRTVNKPKEAFIDRHPLLAKSLSMGITYGRGHDGTIVRI